jgi:hypothetical protein
LTLRGVDEARANARMMTVRRAEERTHKQDAWLTFDAAAPAGTHRAFGVLEGLSERRLAPGARIPRQGQPRCEDITYVREGALSYGDSAGRSGLVHAGEFQRIFRERTVRHREVNLSPTDFTTVFRVSLRAPEGDSEPVHQQLRFTAAQRRNVLCLVASPGGQEGSLRVHQPARIFSGIFDPGRHVVHELGAGHGAWVHIVCGEGVLRDIGLVTGDGVGVTLDRAVSFTARHKTEILLVDLRLGGG